MSQRSTHSRSSSCMLALGAALAVALAAPLAIAANDAADGAAKQSATKQTRADASSQQPVEDSWITTKVKADLLVDDQTKDLDINVSTTNGVVTLAGRLGIRRG